MDLSLFLSFPGILIVVGIVLLLIAIVIGIVAYKTVDSDNDMIEIDDDDELNSKEESSNFEAVPFEKNTDTVLTRDDVMANTVILPNQGQEKRVESSVVLDENLGEVQNVDSKDTVEEKIDISKVSPVAEVTVEEDQDIDLIVDEFTKESNEEFIELSNQNKKENSVENDHSIGNFYIDQEEDLMIAPSTFDSSHSEEENFDVLETGVVSEERPIYGGAKPLDHVDLHFDDDVRKPVYQERFQTMEIPILKENKLDDNEEEIELL